ncbi:MAG: type II toxin-antitoxin system mRNA interferase toxin, RelE/StbE family [Candidatus Omnitrophota bacterium]
MEIFYHKKFLKAFLKLTLKQQEKVDDAIALFRRDPHDPALFNHALHGKEQGKRAISAGGDLRLIFEEEDDYRRVIFVRVGTHSQVYK